jgi:hypothetical protein
MKKEELVFKSLRPAIFYIKEKLGNDLVGAEIGVYKGDNAEFILQLVNPKILYLIDPWNNFMDINSNEIIGYTQYIIAQERLKEYGNKRLLKRTSLEASNLFSAEEFDFVYIDADHNYESVKQDINLWFPKVKRGGVLAGHDYHFTMEGVVKAVNEFCSDNKLTLMYAETDWWVTVK